MDDLDHLNHLGNLMVEFGQDYTYDYGDDETLAFAAFIRGGSRNRTEGALRELIRLDAECSTEAALESALEDAGMAIYRTEGETPYRDFVGRLRTWLTESLADPESQRWDLHPRR